MRQKHRRPRQQHRHHPGRQPLIPLLSSILGKLHAPMQGSQEGEDDRSVGDLDGFDMVEGVEGCGEVDAGDGIFA